MRHNYICHFSVSLAVVVVVVVPNSGTCGRRGRAPGARRHFDGDHLLGETIAHVSNSFGCSESPGDGYFGPDLTQWHSSTRRPQVPTSAAEEIVVYTRESNVIHVFFVSSTSSHRNVTSPKSIRIPTWKLRIPLEIPFPTPQFPHLLLTQWYSSTRRPQVPTSAAEEIVVSAREPNVISFPSFSTRTPWVLPTKTLPHLSPFEFPRITNSTWNPLSNAPISPSFQHPNFPCLPTPQFLSPSPVNCHHHLPHITRSSISRFVPQSISSSSSTKFPSSSRHVLPLISSRSTHVFWHTS